MSAVTVDRPWVRKSLAVLFVLALLAPVFGWAAGAVGYAEPIDVAAAETGAADEADEGAGLLSGYAVPGLGTDLGTFVGAVAGSGLTLAIAVSAGRLLEE